jgi:hypothetical protein
MCCHGDVLSVLVNMLETFSQDYERLSRVLRTVCNFTTSNGAVVKRLIFAGLFERFKNLLSHPKEDIVLETLWGLSNLAADSPQVT